MKDLQHQFLMKLQKKDKVTLLYNNQMTSYYKEEEKHLRKIISKYIKPKKRIMK